MHVDEPRLYRLQHQRPQSALPQRLTSLAHEALDPAGQRQGQENDIAPELARSRASSSRRRAGAIVLLA